MGELEILEKQIKALEKEKNLIINKMSDVGLSCFIKDNDKVYFNKQLHDKYIEIRNNEFLPLQYQIEELEQQYKKKEDELIESGILEERYIEIIKNQMFRGKINGKETYCRILIKLNKNPYDELQNTKETW